MDNSFNKSSQIRNSINDRTQNFFTPSTIQPKNMENMGSHGLDNEYYNYKPNLHNKELKIYKKMISKQI